MYCRELAEFMPLFVPQHYIYPASKYFPPSVRGGTFPVNGVEFEPFGIGFTARSGCGSRGSGLWRGTSRA